MKTAVPEFNERKMAGNRENALIRLKHELDSYQGERSKVAGHLEKFIADHSFAEGTFLHNLQKQGVFE